MDLFGRDAVLDGGAHRHGLPAARAPDQDVIGAIAPNLGPGGGLFVAGAGIGEGLEFELFLFGQGFQDRAGLAAEGAVDMDDGDLLAFKATGFLHVFDQGGGLRPIGGEHREDIGEDRAVGCVAAPMGGGDDHVLVRACLIQDRGGNRRGQEVEENRTFLLGAVIGLDPALRLVAGVAHDGGDGVAVAQRAFGVHEGQVILLALVILPGHEGINRREILKQAEFYVFGGHGGG